MNTSNATGWCYCLARPALIGGNSCCRAMLLAVVEHAQEEPEMWQSSKFGSQVVTD